MNRSFIIKNSIVLLLLVSIHFKVSAQTTKADSIKHLLCDKDWHLIKLTSVKGKPGSMSGDIFFVNTKFNTDGTILTVSKGVITNDTWKLNPETMTLETDQLKDPKSGQVEEKIVAITEKKLSVWITYRGDKIMQYDYEAQ